MNEPTRLHNDAQRRDHLRAASVVARRRGRRVWSACRSTSGWTSATSTGPKSSGTARAASRARRRAPYPVPDLAVEVRSPSTWRFDIGARRPTTSGYGAGELWLVDTAADVVFVFRRSLPTSPRFDVSLELRSRRDADLAAAARLRARRQRDLRAPSPRGSPSRSRRPASGCGRPARRPLPARRSSPSAPPLDPDTIAPAWPIVLPGGALTPAM